MAYSGGKPVSIANSFSTLRIVRFVIFASEGVRSGLAAEEMLFLLRWYDLDYSREVLQCGLGEGSRC